MRPYLVVLALSIIALWITAEVYATHRLNSRWILTAAFPAFVLEIAFFLAATFEDTRTRFAHWAPHVILASLLWFSALAPYLLLSGLAGTFQITNFLFLTLLTGLICFWHVVLPRHILTDIGFLAIAAAPMAAQIFPMIYRSPDDLRIDILGHVMWFRVGIVALLVLRQWDPGPFSLWPRLREWRIGIACYLLAVGPICLVAVGVNDVHYAPLQKTPLVVVASSIGTFFGILWGVALGEDLLFQGVVSQALLRAWKSPVIAIGISAILFGSAHLWFHQFPNWRRALVATVLGVACGIAYLRSGSVRAPMVMHAFVVTTQRLLFNG
jgi:membrane protease YdiL (CAAX protease family)